MISDSGNEMDRGNQPTHHRNGQPKLDFRLAPVYNGLGDTMGVLAVVT
jgi:hypothetical protein